jgi:CO dehydrogenase maturation factor
VKVAVSGKGGVGKTLVAASLAWSFARKGIRTIAIDADSSPNLGLTLGLTPEEAEGITPISEREELIESKTRTDYPGVFRITFSVDDIVRAYAVQTPLGVHLIVMGTVRSAGGGCACPANTVVRNLIRHLVVERDEAVVLDLEAGVEHLGRGTVEHMDVMLLVTDANAKSLATAQRIHVLAREAGIPDLFIVGNRVNGPVEEDLIRAFAGSHGMKVLDMIPYDPGIPASEMQGISPLLQPGTPAIRHLAALAESLLFTGGRGKEIEGTRARGRKRSV